MEVVPVVLRPRYCPQTPTADDMVEQIKTALGDSATVWVEKDQPEFYPSDDMRKGICTETLNANAKTLMNLFKIGVRLRQPDVNEAMNQLLSAPEVRAKSTDMGIPPQRVSIFEIWLRHLFRLSSRHMAFLKADIYPVSTADICPLLQQQTSVVFQQQTSALCPSSHLSCINNIHPSYLSRTYVYVSCLSSRHLHYVNSRQLSCLNSRRLWCWVGQ